MSIVTKKIGKKEYAYLVIREGKKVVHRYLGPAESPQVRKMVSDRKETSAVPERLRPLFWDTNLKNIHIKRNARYIIERVLELGEMDAVKWLQSVYPVQTILDVMNISRAVTERSRNFWKLWFGARDA